MEAIGDPRCLMGPDVLQGGPAVVEQFLAGFRHGCERRDTVLLHLVQNGLGRLVEDRPLLLQRVGRRRSRQARRVDSVR